MKSSRVEIGKNICRAVERGGEAVIFTGVQTSKRGPRERNLPLFKSYLKILPGPWSKSIILSTALNICMVSGIERFGIDEILNITAHLVTIFLWK
jgi:hypothetical protein